MSVTRWIVAYILFASMGATFVLLLGGPHWAAAVGGWVLGFALAGPLPTRFGGAL